MKLICPQCQETNKYTVWKIVNSKKFLCEYCGTYTEKNRFLYNGVSVILTFSTIGLGLYITYCVYSYLYEISSKLIEAAIYLLVMTIVFLVLLPFAGLFICFYINSMARKEHTDANGDAPCVQPSNSPTESPNTPKR